MHVFKLISSLLLPPGQPNTTEKAILFIKSFDLGYSTSRPTGAPGKVAPSPKTLGFNATRAKRGLPDTCPTNVQTICDAQSKNRFLGNYV